MEGRTIAALIDAASAVLRERLKELDELDEALGDGDHGTNLARGFAALEKRKEVLVRLPLGEALAHAGAVLEESVAGPAGRLYGRLLEAMGEAAPAGAPDAAGLAAMVEAGLMAVRREGQVAPGQKTLVDVLAPVADAVRIAVDAGRPQEIGGRVVAAAAMGLHRTSRLQALKGRAAALRERSLGHIDPGACSLALVIGAVVGVLDRQPA